jgi:glycerol-3-phosphate dehydrogenase (NAD(P)+)
LKLAVIGAGAWGTALAKVLSEQHHDVTLWAREEDVRRTIAERRVNDRFLPGIELPRALRVTGALEKAVEGVRSVVFVVPSRYLRSVVKAVAPCLTRAGLIVTATKGLEEGTLLRMSEVIRSELSFETEIVALSGPSFAREVARGELTAIVAASEAAEAALEVQAEFSTGELRLYTNEDIVGVELGGALKNVIALAVGVAAGLELGYNPTAALMTRGLEEISRLAVAAGGKRETLAGLAGMGDLVLTCTGHLSRNRRVGLELGRGRSLADIQSTMDQVAEGVSTTHAGLALADKYDVEMPIVFQMERLLRGETAPRDAMRELMNRPLRAEI